jgi:hypothetical protein
LHKNTSLPKRTLHSSQRMYVSLLRGYAALLANLPGQSSHPHFPLFATASLW